MRVAYSRPAYRLRAHIELAGVVLILSTHCADQVNALEGE